MTRPTAFRLILGAILLLSPQVLAEDQYPQLHAEYWLGHKVRFGKWNTVWVDVITKEEPCRGVLTYTTPGGTGLASVSRPIQVYRDSHVRIPLYVMPRGGHGRLTFQYHDSRTTQEILVPNMGMIQEETWTIGVIGRASVLLPKRVETEKATRISWVTRLNRADFPSEARGFDAVDTIVWSDPDWSDLAVTRVEALVQWIHYGGELVIVPGERWQRLREAPFRQVLPALPVERTDLSDWNWLRARLRRGTSPTGFGSYWTLSSEEGELQGLREGKVLGVRKQVGFGRVTLLAVNPSGGVLRDWDGVRELWSRVLRGDGIRWSALTSLGQERHGSRAAFWSLLQQYRGVQSIGFGRILFFLCLYVLVIGPLDYFLLRHFDRLEWTWVTFPAVVLLAISAAAWWATSAKGTKYLANSITVIDSVPEQDAAQAREWVSLLTPRAGRLRIRCPRKDGLVEPSGDRARDMGSGAVLFEGPGGAELGLPATHWGNSAFCASYTIDDLGAFTFEEHTSGSRLGRLSNDTRLSFRPSYLLFRGHVYRFPQILHPGRPVEVMLSAGHKPLSAPSGFWRNWPNTPGPFGRSTGYGTHSRRIREFGTRVGDPFAYWSLARYQLSLDGTIPNQNQQQHHFSGPTPFHIPGRPLPNRALFLGWTQDMPSSCEIEGVRISRKHYTLFRALLEVGKVND